MHSHLLNAQTPAQTARTYLLCSAAACEGARPGLLNELPRDIPSHEYFPRYGPTFELVSDEKRIEILGSYSPLNTASPSHKEKYDESLCHDMSDSDRQVLAEAYRGIELAILYIDRQREKSAPQKSSFCFDAAMEQDDEWLDGSQRKKKDAKKAGGRRHKKNKRNEANGLQQNASQNEMNE